MTSIFTSTNLFLSLLPSIIHNRLKLEVNFGFSCIHAALPTVCSKRTATIQHSVFFPSLVIHLISMN